MLCIQSFVFKKDDDEKFCTHLIFAEFIKNGKLLCKDEILIPRLLYLQRMFCVKCFLLIFYDKFYFSFSFLLHLFGSRNRIFLLALLSFSR